jgi:L-alanine-DL-glutamate epimerase-like enolase superfamily enzyme
MIAHEDRDRQSQRAAGHVHIASAVPNGYLIENEPRSAGILKAMPVVENGCLVAPRSPGLGLELNQEAVRRFTHNG